MKPNEYIKKYGLKDKERRFGAKEFVADLSIDFKAMVSYHRLSNWNYNKFKLCVKDINQKFKSIQSKTAHPLVSDKLWNYFYATVVGPMKDSMFGEQLKREREERQKRKREREERKQSFKNFNDYFWEQIFEEQFRQTINLLLQEGFSKPVESFSVLGLAEDATESDIKNSYKQLAFQHHPDKQGNPAKFREITEARDRCLAYVSRRAS